MSSTARAPSQKTRTLPAARSASPLRAEVSKWFGPASAARVARFGRIYPGGGRYVCISAPKHDGVYALYFFHHGADEWRTYPPAGVGPSIAYWSVSRAMPGAKAVPG